MKLWDQLGPEEQAALTAEQEALELRALDMGIARYRAERAGSDRSCGSPEQRRIADALQTMVPAVYDLQQHVAQGGSARGVTHWGYPFLCLPADKLSFITLAAMVNYADTGDTSTVAQVSYQIGARVKIERELDVIKQQAPSVYAAVRRHNKNWTKRAHRAAKAKAAEVDYEWTPRTTHWIGSVLIQMAIDHANMFDLERFQRDGKTIVRVKLKADVSRMIEDAHAECELLRPFYLPTVVPPKPWTEAGNGGYFFHRMPLVKRHFKDSKREDLSKIPLVLEAVNALQATPWRINERVLEVMSQVWKSGGGWAGTPEAEPLTVPPPDFDWAEASEERRRAWKVKAAKVHGENAKLGSKRKSMIHKLWIAGHLRGRAIYFPHQLDWRGRAYPTASHLHPQSDDSGRGLLEFAEGRPLGKRGAAWLASHLANCYSRSTSKLPYEEKSRWMRDHSKDIAMSAADPLGYRWWAKAKKPWQTLAACFELAEADRPGFLSHIPVQVDGSCNGLQHLSAMGRDAWGAQLVNLLPNDMPLSVYETVAGAVNNLLVVDAGSNELWRDAKADRPALTRREMAARWKGRITADVVKRPTMTIVYGLTHGGMMKQYLEDGWCNDVPGQLVDNAAYLRDKTWAALNGTLKGASDIMRWLREVASIAAKQNKAVRWTTPIGFPVVQEYLENRCTYLYTALQKLTIHLPGRKISEPRQVRGLPPNFVHSMDAAHMMWVTLNCRNQGITSFSMVHDSFGVPADRVDDLQAAIRGEFVSMYTAFTLGDVKAQWEADLGVQLPDLPDPGLLDLDQVLQSQYMFC